ncbi:MAG: LTA synthase family protein [Rikenellaceae bacterium]
MNKSIKTIVKIYLSTLIALQLCRLLFVLTYLSRTAELGIVRILNSAAHGFIQDIPIAGWVSLPIICIAAATMVGNGAIANSITTDPLRRIVRVYLAAVALVVAAVTTVDANLFGYWGYRLDATILPYLASPTEAAASVSVADIAVGALLFFAALIPSVWLFWRSTTEVEEVENSNSKPRWIWVVALATISVGSTSIGSISASHFSSTLLANQIATNPLYSLAWTYSDRNNSAQYRLFDNDDEPQLLFGDFRGNIVSEPTPILKSQQPNIAIVICESFSRTIMDLDAPIDGSCDTTAVMPNLRRIAAEGISFDNAIASGTRTDKGLVSILSGFVSQPRSSILNTPDKSAQLPSIASALGREGYRSSFYYGGNSDYMNMHQYLKSTGWQNIVDTESIESTTERAQRWGWSDAIMMERFADDIIAMSSDDQPFVTTLLTLSSHEPFDTPHKAGFAEPILDAMHYTDTELGRLYDRLRESDAWDNLLLIVVADHATNYPRSISYDSPTRHHIPLVFGGGAIEIPLDAPYFESKLSGAVSQCDIVATVLSQMGIDRREFIFSRDVFDRNSARPQYAYYTYNNGFGIVKSGGSMTYDITNNVAGITFVPIDSEVTYTKGGLLTPSDWSYLKIGKCLMQRTFDEMDKL